jgi:hypothetical protein
MSLVNRREVLGHHSSGKYVYVSRRVTPRFPKVLVVVLGCGSLYTSQLKMYVFGIAL